jgi:outer membrane protein OmpA-like peptidoglycan-associated protein
MRQISIRWLGGMALAGMLATLASAPQAASVLGITSAYAADNADIEATAKQLRKRKTRSGTTYSADVNNTIDELTKIRKTRGWNMHDRARFASVEPELPKVDFVIYFAFDSADISPESEPELARMGQTLSRDEFKGSKFVLAGHTDGKGTPEYNQPLSERRADAVRRHLAEKYNLSTDTLMTVGFGSEQLKNSDNKFADENRRVQVINFTK